MTDSERDRLRAQSLQIALDLEDARRATARIARVLGGIVTALGALVGYAVFEGMRSRGIYVAELVFLAAWGLVAGGMMIALGAGGAARIAHVPMTMWAAWGVASALVALVLFIPLGRVIAYFAGYDGLS